MKVKYIKMAWRYVLESVCCISFLLIGIAGGYAQNLGKNIVTNGDFGKLPAGADANTYRQQYSNGVAPDEGEEFFVDYLSSGNFSQRKHQYVLAAKMNAFYSSWKNISASEGGLMMIVEGNAAWVNSSEKFYKRTFDLPSGNIYHFSLEVCNVWNQKGHGFLNALRIFDPWIAVNYNSENHKTNQIEYQNGWVKLEFDVVIPDEGKANFEFYVGHTAGGTGLGGDAWGTDFALDNIKLEPYLLTPGSITFDGCQATSAGTVTLLSSVSGGPSGNETKYARWMRRDKGTETWEWIGDVVEGNDYACEQDTATFRQSEYRVLFSFSKSLLASLTTPPTENSDYYAFSEIYAGKALPKPALGVPEGQCKIGTALNLGRVAVEIPEGVSEVSWQVDEGEINTVACTAGQNTIDFEFGATHRNFKIVSYKVPEFCAVPLLLTDLSFDLQSFYIPNTVAGDISAEPVVLCNGESGILEAELARKVIQNPVFYWYDHADLTGDPMGTGLSVALPAGLSTGEHIFYVTLQADNRCPSIAGEAKEVAVRINTPAVADEIVVTGDFAVCEHVPLALTAAIAEATDIVNPQFEWYTSADFNAASLLAVAPSYYGDSLPSGQQHLYVRMWADNRCRNLAGEGKEVEVSITPRGLAEQIVIEGDTRLCRADELHLVAKLADGQTVTDAQFRWYEDAGLTQAVTDGVSANGNEFTRQGLLPGQYGWFVTLQGQEFCENESGAALRVVVEVLDSLQLPVIPEDTVRIFKDDAAVLSLNMPSATALQYEWYANADLSGEILGTGKTVTVEGLTEGVHAFYVRMKDENSCWSRAVTVPVRVYPATNIRVDNISVCQGNAGELSVKTALTGLEFLWSDLEDGSRNLGEGQSLLLPADLSVGEHVYYVWLKDNTTQLTVRQSAKVSVVPRASIGGAAFTGSNIFCVGHMLKIPFEMLENAVEYRVTLKTTSLEGFDFPEYKAAVTPELLNAGELAVAAEDFVIPAAMNGNDFVISIELIGATLNNGGDIETCSTVRDFVFSVKKLPEITIDEPQIVCAGGGLSLAPEVLLNDNEALEYEWRTETEIGEVLLQAGKLLELSDLTGAWNGRQVWCRVRTECGWQESNRVTLRVYDDSFNTISYDGGPVYSGMMVQITGSEIPINGLVYSWERKALGEDWRLLESKNISLFVSIGLKESFRRIVQAGACGSISNEVEVMVTEFSDSTGVEEGMGRYVYQETFGYVSQFEWTKENGDKRDISTYRKTDHTGGINLSKYSMQNFELKSTDEWEESVNDIDRLPEKNPLMFYSGEWTFQETNTNLITEPWTKYKYNTAYVWCTDNMFYYTRTEYVENGTYCAGNIATCKQPTRWFYVDGSWKMGYWYRYYYTWKNPSMGDGKYALTPCPYQMDPGALIKYSKSLDHTVDPLGETGLMLMVNSAGEEVAYSQTITGLTGGMWYRLEAWVANAEAGGWNARPNIKIEVTGNGVVGEDGLPSPAFTTGSLERNDELNWTRCTVNFLVPEGVTQAQFAVYNTNGSGAGNVFLLDDISVREMLVKNWNLAADFCERPGDLTFTLSNEMDLPDYAVGYSRLMRKNKDGGVWEWASEVSDSLKLVTASDQMVNYDLRVAEAFSSTLLDRIDPNDPAAANALGYYAVTEKYTVPDFCLVLNSYQVDYVSVVDSIVIQPAFLGLPEYAEVYSRFLFRPMGSEVWEWHGEAAPAAGHYFAWTDLLEGDCKVVYAFSSTLLETMKPDGIAERGAYYVATDVIAGVRPELTIFEKITDGQVVLKPEVEGLPMGALPAGCWMERPKGSQEWKWLPMNEELTFKASLFDYSAGEYRFVYTQSATLIDTLSVQHVDDGGKGFLVSDVFSGQKYSIGELAADFCASPGNVDATIDVSSEYPEDIRMHGRWRQKEKEGDEWSWMTNNVYGLPDFTVTMADYLSHDYQLILSWSRDSLRTWESSSLPENNQYYRNILLVKELSVCISVDTIHIVSVDSAKFELRPVVTSGNADAALAGRWLRAPAGTAAWEWQGEAGTGSVNLAVSEDELGQFDYRYVTGWESEWFTDIVMQERRSYLAGDTLKSVAILHPELQETNLFCVSGQDSNRIELWLDCPEEISSITYRIAEGEEQTVSWEGKQAIGFPIAADAAFSLLSYAQEGVCDRIILNRQIPFVYKPRPQISNMTDMFTCLNNEIRIAPEVTGTGTLQREWYKGDEMMPFFTEDTLKMNLVQSDTLELLLKVKGDEVCPAEKSVFVIAADYPEILLENEVRQICVGEPFRMEYLSTTAEQYRVVLKESTMPGFSLYSGLMDIGEKNDGKLEIFSGQSLLYATEFMAGHRFTFQVRLYRYVGYNGGTYSCEDEFPVTFEVKSKPVSRYVGDIYACMNETVALNPEVESSGNLISGYCWRLWNSDSVSVAKVLVQSDRPVALNAVADSSWQGKRLQLAVDCECGEIVVQDILLNILDNRENVIAAPEGIVFAGENVRLTGRGMHVNGIGYQWEHKPDGEEWLPLTGETEAGLNIRVPEKRTAYRRLMVSDAFHCEDKYSNTVVLKVYNNEQENLIQMALEDTLVSKGKNVVITGVKARQEEVRFIWQKNDTGIWEELENDGAQPLELVVDGMTMVRRKAIAGEKEMYSNVLLIHVFDAGSNTIMAPLSVVLPGEQLRIIGNYFDVDGVTYKWWMKPESTDTWQLLASEESRNLERIPEESASYKREVYLPTGVMLESNVLRITVFDNERDNIIRSEKGNVCKYDEVQIAGQEIGGPETVYRWEISQDNGDSWEVLDNQNGATLSYVAENSVLLRRFVGIGNAYDYSSNVLFLRVVYASVDNVIAFTSTVSGGQEAEIKGTEVDNATYIWEKSENGQDNWQELTGVNTSSLHLKAEETTKECYFRRRLKFEDGGCEAVSDVLKMVIMNREKNHISGPEKPICQWSEFTLSGEDLSEVEATYQWYWQDGKEWKPCEYAFQKDLVVYEGVPEDRVYRRDVTVGGQIYESNLVSVTVWKNDRLENVLEQPEAVCAGGEVVLQGSELLVPEWEGFVKGYYWEKSATAAGGTWSKADTVGGRDLTVSGVEVTEWYCRVVTTYCGNDYRSEPVLLQVKERLPLTLRHNASFGQMKVKEPIRISVDEDDYSTYEFKLDGEIKQADHNEYLFYGWLPKKDYQVVVNVVSRQGCIQTDTMQMRTPDSDLPNVLTPNNDGFNDVLLAGYDLKVYNRWGNLIYSGRDGWDGRYKGKLLAAGTYFYVVKIGYENGSMTEYKRSVTLKRD